MSRRLRGAGLAIGLGAFALAPDLAGAHLFHTVYEAPETQLTRDARVLLLLVDDPAGSFAVARGVYTGDTRVRLKPGGFRRWLLRPSEPGLVFKAGYQLTRWSGSLKTEAERVDRERGSRLAPRLEAALGARDREAVHAALREMFVVLIEELLESLAARLDQPETAARLYALVPRYYGVALEAYLNVRDPGAGTIARAALDAMARALPDPETGAPPAPEAFDQQRRRFLRAVTETVARP
ncbi:MAG: hypothetical protein HY217_02635 [Candidatus Rokubacteria bacterium]|nr:hypothetical protein [Candidatus Rokubacteria bacterium]